MQCTVCSDKYGSDPISGVSTIDVSNMFLKSLKNKCDEIRHPDTNDGTHQSEDDITFPSSKERRDILTYRYPLDNLSSDSHFYCNSEVRHHIATRRMNEHDWKHRPSCFKYGKECRAPFPRQSCESTQFEEDKDDEEKCTRWKSLMKKNVVMYPFIINPKRSLSSEYMNIHSKSITRMLGCNSNVQIRSLRCMFYVVHYSTKSTQKEDKGTDFKRVGNQVI